MIANAWNLLIGADVVKETGRRMVSKHLAECLLELVYKAIVFLVEIVTEHIEHSAKTFESYLPFYSYSITKIHNIMESSENKMGWFTCLEIVFLILHDLFFFLD